MHCSPVKGPNASQTSQGTGVHTGEKPTPLIVAQLGEASSTYTGKGFDAEYTVRSVQSIESERLYPGALQISTGVYMPVYLAKRSIYLYVLVLV